MRMGDLGEPPVSAGFCGGDALSRRGSYAGLDTTIAGLVVEVRKLNRSYLPANAVNPVNPAAVIKYVTCSSPKSERVQPTHLIDGVNRMQILLAQFQDVEPHIHVVSGHIQSHFEENSYK